MLVNAGAEIDYLERIMTHTNSLFAEQYVEIDISQLDTDADDILVNPIDIERITSKVLIASENINQLEKDYLLNRGITIDIINDWKIGSLSSITDINDMITLSATCHPVLRTFLTDGIEGGGIIIPLFKDGKLINCAVRKLSDIGKLKYSLSCPDVDVWGLDDISNEEVWITEGLFDMMALRSIGLKSVSVSSAAWSGIQIYKLLMAKPKRIVIFCDNDGAGLRTGFKLHKLFNIKGIPNKTVISNKYKDAAEHIFQNGLGINDIIDVEIDSSMISKQDNFNFLDYLKNRKY